MKKTRAFPVATVLLFLSSGLWAEAKGMGGPICGMLTFRDVAVIVRAHVATEGGPAIIVDQSYYGPYKAGERVPVEKLALQDELTVPGGGSQPEMFLVLEKAEYSSDKYYYGSLLFSEGLVINRYLSRRLSDGNVYFWNGNTKTASYRLWYYFTNTASLTRDETHWNLPALETDLREGLTRHNEWWRAKAATDPAEKLALLRPFLLPGGPHHFTAYDVWSCTDVALKEAEKTELASMPFLEELLTEPSFQEGYAPEGWTGYGTGERDKVKRSIALVAARAAANPQEKLAKLRPVFDTIDFFTTAGFDRHGAVEEYLDRGLAVATSVDAADARPFLQGLLALPQFQEGYEPVGQTSFGHMMREKIEAALTELR